MEVPVNKSVNSASAEGRPARPVALETVADILERSLETVIREWLVRVEKEP